VSKISSQLFILSFIPLCSLPHGVSQLPSSLSLPNQCQLQPAAFRQFKLSRCVPALCFLHDQIIPLCSCLMLSTRPNYPVVFLPYAFYTSKLSRCVPALCFLHVHIIPLCSCLMLSTRPNYPVVFLPYAFYTSKLSRLCSCLILSTRPNCLRNLFPNHMNTINAPIKVLVAKHSKEWIQLAQGEGHL